MPSERHCVEHLLTLAQATRTRKLQLQETIALGLLVALKWDKAKLGKPSGYIPNATDLNGADQFTDGKLSNFRETAQSILDQHVEKHITWRQWWSGVGQGLMAALLYSIILFGFGALAVHLHGGDLGGIIRNYVGENPSLNPHPPTNGTQHSN